MNKFNKVKVSISRNQEEKLITGLYSLIDNSTGLVKEPEIRKNKYKHKLNNKKDFMKKWTDRKLNLKLTENLRVVDLGFLYLLTHYIDKENIIDFKRLKIDKDYTDSKISKCKKPLFENNLIKQDEHGFIYLNPLIGIKQTEVTDELLEMFQDSFKSHGIDITL